MFPDHELEIVVSLQRDVRVLLDDPTEADAFTVLDDEGDELELHATRETARGERRVRLCRGRLVAGASEVLSVPDHAAAIVLWRRRRRVREVPIDLVEGAGLATLAL